MKNIIEALKERKGDLLTGKGDAEGYVQQAEIELDTSFASDFRSCLLAFGTFAFDSHEFTGISLTPRLSVTEVTRKHRMLNARIPTNWYVIEEANIDGIVVWQAPDGKIFLTQYNGAPVQSATGLEDFLHLSTK